MSNIYEQDLAQYGMNYNPVFFGVPVVIEEGLDEFEGAAGLLASQVVERALEETESSQVANHPAVEEDGPTELECVEEEYEEGDKEKEEQDNEEEDNREKKNPNEEVQKEEDDTSSLSSFDDLDR